MVQLGATLDMIINYVVLNIRYVLPVLQAAMLTGYLRMVLA